LTQNEKNSNCKEKLLLLFSPLDWGLGHTTRSIPLLGALLKQGFRVVVACDSTQKAILSKELPALEFTYLAGYNIRYGASGARTLVHLLLQLPKILTKIKHEKRWLAAFLAKNKVAALISDNRYGLHHPHLPCILITHQLQPNTGLGAIADRFLQKRLYVFINSFKECWVPDVSGQINLAGSLSHPHFFPLIPTHYIGPLSRLLTPTPDSRSMPHLLFLLSGPEPQRSAFEKIILRELGASPRRAILVRGLAATAAPLPDIAQLTVIPYADANTISHLCSAASFVVCRPGYTTIMDMVALKMKMIVVPTPGQGEQEYLALHLQKNHMAVAEQQNNFSVDKALIRAGYFPYDISAFNMEQYKKTINRFSQELVDAINV